MTVPQENLQRAVRRDTDHKIKIAIFVEIADSNGRGLRGYAATHAERGSVLESSIAVAEKNVNNVSATVGHGDVDIAISIEVASGKKRWIRSCGNVLIGEGRRGCYWGYWEQNDV